MRYAILACLYPIRTCTGSSAISISTPTACAPPIFKPRNRRGKNASSLSNELGTLCNPSQASWRTRSIRRKIHPPPQGVCRNAISFPGSFGCPGSAAEGDPDIRNETPKILAVLSEAHKISSALGVRFAIIYLPAVGEDVAAYQQDWARGESMLLDWAQCEQVSVVDMHQDYAAIQLVKSISMAYTSSR